MISHEHKTIFIHIPKCAGRSISHAFNQDFDHYTASYYCTTHSQYWTEYTVFTTVRNPYQRLVSMYNYIKGEPVHRNHAITNYGNMPDFKSWIMTNMAAFKGEFIHPSTEGNREEDSEVGSAFWFSSQVHRLSVASSSLCSNIHILRYEDGLPAVARFLQQQTGAPFHIPHLNSSCNDNHSNYLRYYDEELLNAVNTFSPFVKDCTVLHYDMIHDIHH